MRGLLIAATAITLCCSGCVSVTTAPATSSPPVAASPSSPAPAQAACDAYFDLTKARDDAGVTITSQDMTVLDVKFDAAIQAAAEGSKSEPLLEQMRQELVTMKAVMDAPTVDTFKLSASAQAVTRYCLVKLKVKPPDWLNSGQ